MTGKVGTALVMAGLKKSYNRWQIIYRTSKKMTNLIKIHLI